MSSAARAVYHLAVGGINVSVTNKRVRHLGITVHADGRVRVSAPLRASRALVLHAVTERAEWIRRQQVRFAARPTVAAPAFVSGEQHHMFGVGYTLLVIEGVRRARIRILDDAILELAVPAGADTDARRRALDAWYRREMAARIPPLIETWQRTIGVQVAQWGIKRMRTKWGTCNTRARRIWLSLELAKKPPQCLEYIVVHELVHLLERRHNDRFRAFMDRFLPDWRQQSAMLRYHSYETPRVENPL